MIYLEMIKHILSHIVQTQTIICIGKLLKTVQSYLSSETFYLQL